MADNEPRFIVTGKPKWYNDSSYKDVFACASAQGLFDSVADLMVCKQAELSESEQRRNPTNIHKTIRDKVLQNAKYIRQEPSVELLRALMDLVDVEGGNGFDCVANVDKVGMKHLLIASGNYTVFYVPQKELKNPNGKKVIPVVTQSFGTHNIMLYDKHRSMIGTYIVQMPQIGEDHGKTFFLQEVLFVPGHKSLELLKVVTCNKYEFWDMALEMPTDLKALMPCFQRIHPSQLLSSDANPGTQSNSEALASHMSEIDPMCCVVGTDAAELTKSKRDKSLDCLRAEQVRYNLTHFRYENGGKPTVYYKRNSGSVDGKRTCLVPVVILRQGQCDIRELYVSTTVRFCRAVKRSCVKGSGEIVSTWLDTIKDLERDTFILGPEMHQEIYNPALTAFIKRVNPNSWCNYTPKHIASTVGDPVAIEVLDLAIKFMDSKIPNAFAVAGLLHCPMKKVHEYQRFWNAYNSDTRVNTAVQKTHHDMILAQMALDWTKLGHIASSYGQVRYQGDDKMVLACKALYKDFSVDNAAKAQKMWHSLIRPDPNKDKLLVHLYSKAKLLFIKLRTKYKKVKKGLKSRGEPAEEADGTDRPSKPAVEGKDRNKFKTGVQSALYSIAIPEAVPICTWLKNMSTLLMSEPWLSGEHLRREAVCTLLALDNTLLDSRHSVILKEWVINNRPVVNVLDSHSLQDRLSKALVDCLASTSTEHWKHKILMSFQGAPSQSMGFSTQTMRDIERNTRGFLGKRRGHGKQLQHTRIQEHAFKKMPSTSKSFGAKLDMKAQTPRSHIYNQITRYNKHIPCVAMEASGDEGECHEAAEYEGLGEDLAATYSNKYDYSDKFLDDGPTAEDSGSSEEEAEEAFSAQHQRRRRAVRRPRRVSQSESEEEDYPRQPGSGGDTKGDTVVFKRVLSSSSDEELSKPTVKRHKQEKERLVKEKLIRAEKETSDPHLKREEETRKRQDGSKRCKTVKPNKNIHAPRKQDSPTYKNELSAPETDDSEVPWGGVKANIKCPTSPVTQARQEKRRSHSKTQKARPDNTPSQKRETVQQGKTQGSFSNYPVPKASRWSPGATQSQVPRLHGEAANFDNLTKQVVWPSDTSESDNDDRRDPSSHPDESPSEDEDRSSHPDESTSEDEDHSSHPDESPSEDSDSDLEAEGLDIKPDQTGCDEIETDSDDNNCDRVHI